MYIKRDLNSTNLEIFRVRERIFDNLLGCLAIADFRRPSSLEDYPYLKGIEDEKDFGKDNFIKAIMLSENELTDNNKESILTLLEGLLSEKEECDWNIDFYVIRIDFEDIKIEQRIKEVGRIFEEKYQYKIGIKEIKQEQYKYLTQQ